MTDARGIVYNVTAQNRTVLPTLLGIGVFKVSLLGKVPLYMPFFTEFLHHLTADILIIYDMETVSKCFLKEIIQKNHTKTEKIFPRFIYGYCHILLFA